MRVMKIAAALAVAALASYPAAAGQIDRGGEVLLAQGKGRGNDKHDGHGGHGRGNDGERRGGPGAHFGGNDRSIVSQYFAAPPGGNCPPGLAKKNNGCQPPGQARKWALGQRLPRDVVTYDVPGDLLRRLTPAPTGHRYVRVGTDILLLAIGTSLIVDALTGG